MRLVRNLAQNQLHGEIKYSQVDGLEVEVVFPPVEERYD
jgi:two-component sensor histidine kinase